MFLSRRSVLFVIAAVVFSFSGIRADLPVHCVQPQTVGTWRFHVGSWGAGEGDARCGYSSPDDPDGHQDLTPPVRDPAKKQKGKYWLSDQFHESFSLEVLLKDWTSQVLSVSEAGAQLFPGGELPKGEWTMVYDEGFQVTASSSAGDVHSFFAFHKYMLGPDDSPGSTDNFGNREHSFCDTTLLGFYKTFDPVTRSKKHEGCFWGERIGGIDKALGLPGAVPVPIPNRESPVTTKAADRPLPADPPHLPSTPSTRAVAPHQSQSDDDAALRGLSPKPPRRAPESAHPSTDGALIGFSTRAALLVSLVISMFMTATGLFMNLRYHSKPTSFPSVISKIAIICGFAAAVAIVLWFWHHRLGDVSVPITATVPKPAGGAISATPLKRAGSQSIKEVTDRMHAKYQEAKQSGKIGSWTFNKTQVTAWLRERHEKHGIDISEHSEVQQLLDMMSPPLRSGLPGFSSDQVIGPVRAAAVEEQIQIAADLGKLPRELTTEDLKKHWNASGTNHHAHRNFSMQGRRLDTDDWKTLVDFDWRKVSLEIGGGVVLTDFVSAVTDQGGCGSCWAVAATSMITSRLMLRYPELHDTFAAKKGADRISVKQQMDCNQYGQGCGGGYPYLVTKWGYENDLYTDRCYQQSKESGKCSATMSGAACENSFKVQHWRYLGGALGRCGMHHLCEAVMREELYKGGPLVTSIEPGAGFGSAGVYRGTPGIDDKGLLYEAHTSKDNKDCASADCYIWRKVDHSILLVGWGEDMEQGPSCQARYPKIAETDTDPVSECASLKTSAQCKARTAECVWQGYPYWTIQNSYGPSFSDHGFFSFGPRGQDPMRVESMTVGADVEWIRRPHQGASLLSSSRRVDTFEHNRGF